ncbi:MAG: patatin-like phospholipase family protein [Planctomycetes bacterium]|nr:patatin-like phospholipase family protein [Planctomycetota bacterium]
MNIPRLPHDLRSARSVCRLRWASVWLLIIWGVVAMSGCATLREHPAPNLPRDVRLIDRPHSGNQERTTDDMIMPASGIAASKLEHVLVLSGGGMNGAFPAGLLKGWSESGTRPKFDVVTGISTGALIAPYAFLGPECDADLERAYTTVKPGEIFRPRFLLSLPWSDALADSEPLRHRIKKEVTADMLMRIAQEHREGRRLYVGTTNLDNQELVVWDMGAIAAGDDPQKLALFQEILLASCSIPGLLPPVEIHITIDGRSYSELHADGNVGASLFLPSQLQSLRSRLPDEAEAGRSNVYVVIAGKLAPERTTVPKRLYQVTDVSLRGLMQSQMESDLQRVFLLTRMTGSNFHLAAIPDDVPLPSSSLSFDPKTMRTVFESGRQFGRKNSRWQAVPPGIDPADWKSPRVGTAFMQQEFARPREVRAPHRAGPQREPSE